MASTINASTSAGIIQTADTSGVLALQTGGTTGLTLNPTGSVAFGTSSTAYGTSGQVLTSNGDAVPTWSAPPASMIYPGAGVAVSNGSAWGTSLVAASANTANALVQRDGSGNFTAGTITANLATTAASGIQSAYQASLNVTTPGLGTYGIHFNGQLTADFASGITWNGGTTSTNSQAGIYVQGSGAYGTKMYIATTDSYATGAKSAISIDHLGAVNILRSSLTATGNITAFSDERVKTNWRDLQPDFIEQLAKVKHGIYDRTDQEITQVGVSAQSLQPVLEHAVIENDHGQLSVAYGNAALVACIKLAERVLELEAKLEQLTKDKS
jgi:hypothetical protein